MKKIPFSALLVSVIVLTSVVVYSAEAAGIPKKAISTVAKFLESDLPTTTVFTDVPNTITAAITMNSLTPTLGGAENANNQQINSLAAPTHSTDAQVANHLGLTGSLVTAACGDQNHLKYQTSNSTWICDTATYLTSAITSLNGNSGASQTIAGQSGNITIADASSTHTVGLGSNAVITGGSAQTVTKSLTLNSLILGGSENANNQRITSLGTPTASTDAQIANKLGLLGNMVVGTCSAGQVLQYQTSNSTWICSTPVGRTLLGSTTLASAVNTISVSYDPTGYSKIEYDIYTGTLSGSSTVEMQFNSDTSAHYTWSKLVAATATTGTSASFCLFDTTGSALERQLRVNILPAPSSAFQGAHWEGQTEAAAVSTAPLLLSGSCSWNGATTITSVQIKTTTGTIKFPVGAFVNVYGS